MQRCPACESFPLLPINYKSMKPQGNPNYGCSYCGAQFTLEVESSV